jgi:hypothetical protein
LVLSSPRWIVAAENASRDRGDMRVAIFTDNDFTKVNGVTTTLRAVLDHAPDSLDLRVYTCEAHGMDVDEYLALPPMGSVFRTTAR